MHLAVFPRPMILIIYPSLPAHSRNPIVCKFALEKASCICLFKYKFASAMFFIFFKIANILGAIRESLFTLTLFLPIFPFALILTVIFGVVVFTIAIGLVIIPLSSIVATKIVYHYPHAMLTVGMPIANIVQCLIWKLIQLIEHDTISVSGFHISLTQKYSLAVDWGEQSTIDAPVLRYMFLI